MSQSQATLLFVDDEERILRSLDMAFRHRYRVLTANDGQAALSLLEREKVDVIISDQKMPRMTGVEFLREARQLRPDAIRILLTGYSELSGVVGSINEGEIFRYIQKPWHLQDFRDAIASAVSVGQQTADLPQAAAVSSQASVVVLHRTPALADFIAEKRPQVQTWTATDFDQALALLDEHPEAMLLTDLHLPEGDIGDALSLLKQHRPELVMVILTRFSDTQELTRLINRVQVYRVLPIPLSRNMLLSSLDSAVRHQSVLLHNPALRKRHQVNAGSGDVPMSGLLTRVKRYFSGKTAVME